MSKIAFIVEGEKTEEMILDSLCQVFLPSKREIEMIVLPATTNIYTIWKKLKADDWETKNEY